MVSDHLFKATLLLLLLEKVFGRLLAKRIEVASHHALHGVVRPYITAVFHDYMLLPWQLMFIRRKHR